MRKMPGYGVFYVIMCAGFYCGSEKSPHINACVDIIFSQ
jgi:hypothetical protein